MAKFFDVIFSCEKEADSPEDAVLQVVELFFKPDMGPVNFEVKNMTDHSDDPETIRYPIRWYYLFDYEVYEHVEHAVKNGSAVKIPIDWIEKMGEEEVIRMAKQLNPRIKDPMIRLY